MKVECRLHDYIKPDYNEGESKPLIVRGPTLIFSDRVEVQIGNEEVQGDRGLRSPRYTER